MLLIWGFKVRFRTLLQGVFFCPSCGGDRQYERKQGRRWFTFFFIPVIPLNNLGEEFVECTTCRQAYKPSVLQMPTTATLSDDLTLATREAVVWLLRSVALVDPASLRVALEVLSTAANRPWGEHELQHDMASLEVSGLPARLQSLAGVLNEHGRESFLSSCVRVAAAGGGPINEGQRALLDSIAASLGMTPAHARGVIAQTQEQAGLQ
jgi:hypothetical protein